MRTRIRCPLCGALGWETSFKKGPYQIEVKAMKGAGKAKGFTFFPVDDPSFLQRVHDFLTERISTLANVLQLGIIRSESHMINALKSRINELETELKWLKSKSVLIQTATHGSWLMTDVPSVNQNLSAIPRNEAMTSSKSSRIL